MSSPRLSPSSSRNKFSRTPSGNYLELPPSAGFYFADENDDPSNFNNLSIGDDFIADKDLKQFIEQVIEESIYQLQLRDDRIIDTSFEIPNMTSSNISPSNTSPLKDDVEELTPVLSSTDSLPVDDALLKEAQEKLPEVPKEDSPNKDDVPEVIEEVPHVVEDIIPPPVYVAPLMEKSSSTEEEDTESEEEITTDEEDISKELPTLEKAADKLEALSAPGATTSDTNRSTTPSFYSRMTGQPIDDVPITPQKGKSSSSSEYLSHHTTELIYVGVGLAAVIVGGVVIYKWMKSEK